MAFRPALAGLLPHPPVIVPEVGGEHARACRRTHEASAELARRIVEAAPARVVLVSPHAPRRPPLLRISDDARCRGDLRRFGARGAGVDLPSDAPFRDALRSACQDHRVRCEPMAGEGLDHGAVVPLWFLARAGWDGPTTVLSLPTPGGSPEACGASVAGALARLGAPASAALIASGDMSHRLAPGAPAGHDPRAAEFDAALRACVEHGRLDEIGAIDPELRGLAAEDASESTRLVASACGGASPGHEVLSYEAPFGVGYLVAVLHDGSGSASATPRTGAAESAAYARLPAIAREAIAAHLARRAPAIAPARGPLASPRGVFVTLRVRASGELRGCIGSLSPTRDDLVAETVDRAIAAATQDPRFRAVKPRELPALRIEVSVLGAAEPIAGADELDPRRYGVVVQDDRGRTGVLLPGVAGVETGADQIAIARRKAGIAPEAAIHLSRFETVHVEESA